MPAITLGLAEIEERLRLLRRRLNAVVVQDAVYISGSVVVLVAAALVVLALRGSASTFRMAVWAGASLSAAVFAGGVVFLRRRWLDSQTIAHFVDRRAQLTDRLATIIALRRRQQPSRLAPMLIAQALGLGGRWQLQEIAPRRVPYSVVALLASIVVLALTAFTARHQPASGSAAAVAEGSAESVAMPAGLRPRSPLADAPPGGASATGGTALRPATDSGTSAAASAATADSASGADPPRADGALAALPDRLQDAIRHAFNSEVMDKPRALAEATDKGSDGSGEGTQEDGATKRQPQTSGLGKPKPRSGPAPEGSGRDLQKPSKESGGDQRGGQRQDMPAPSGDFKGSSPAAGPRPG